MTFPFVSIDLDKIERNARTIVALCKRHGIVVSGVTKGVCGNPHVAKAMLRGGVCTIADSRLQNIHRLQDAGVATRYTLLRLPSLSIVEDVVESVQVSLNSELSVLASLSKAALSQQRIHEVIVMVDLGDLREGIWPKDVVPFMREALQLRGVRILGLGTNLACFGGAAPSEDNMRLLVELTRQVERTFNMQFGCISGLNSSGLELVAANGVPERVNHARIGEAILLGRETTHRKPWPGTDQNAFMLHAEVLEMKSKPSRPVGGLGEDAFGQIPRFKDRGVRDRALLNVGREDIDVNGVTPLDLRMEVVGASSGYLVVDVTDIPGKVRVGDTIVFKLNYSALLRTMTSAYVKKQLLSGGSRVD